MCASNTKKRLPAIVVFLQEDVSVLLAELRVSHIEASYFVEFPRWQLCTCPLSVSGYSAYK
jgi:hypothetical protein